MARNRDLGGTPSSRSLFPFFPSSPSHFPHFSPPPFLSFPRPACLPTYLYVEPPEPEAGESGDLGVRRGLPAGEKPGGAPRYSDWVAEGGLPCPGVSVGEVGPCS